MPGYGQPWTLEDDEKLKNTYFKYETNKLDQIFPNRSISAIRQRANKFGLCKSHDNDSKIHRLLYDCHESYYWIGLLLADGSIFNKKLSIKLHYKDFNYIELLAKYIGLTTKYSKYKNQIGFSISNRDIVPLIMQKFDWKHNKTYNPPDITTYNLDYIKSLFIGYVDGDGHIRTQFGRKDCLMSIRVHSSWLTVLKDFYSILEIDGAEPYVSNDGYAIWTIAYKNVIKLKQHIIDVNIPYFKRKWDKVDLNYYC